MKSTASSPGLQRRLFSGLLWLLALNLLVKPFWILGIEVGVQNAVGSEAYGFYFAIFNLSYIFNIVLDLGITNFNTRNIARYPKLIDKHLSGILGVKLLLLCLYLLVTFSVGALMGYKSTQFYLLAWLCLNQFLNSLILYLRSNFEGLLLFRWDSLLSVLDRVLMIVICGFLLWAPQCSILNSQFSIFHFVYAQTAAYLVTAAVALAVLIRKTGLRRLRWNWPFTLVVLKKSLPFALLVLLMASYNRLDPVLLQLLSPDGTGDFNAGLYAGAFRLLDALTMIAYLVSVPLLPVFSKMTKECAQHPTELRDTVRHMFSLMMLFAVAAACALSSRGSDLMELFYVEHVAGYASVFRVLIFCIIPISTTYIFGTLLTAAGKLRQLNLFAALTLGLNLLLNILFIPWLGVVGSAYAAVTAQCFMAVAQVVAAVRIFALRPTGGYILKLALLALCIVGIAFCTPHLAWWIALPVVAVAATALAWVLGLLEIKGIMKLLKIKQ